ncbi:trp operon leader peptide, partial [Escherichia coli]|nr:trp operon leader peptide [Escherichia coli]
MKAIFVLKGWWR